MEIQRGFFYATVVLSIQKIFYFKGSCQVSQTFNGILSLLQ